MRAPSLRLAIEINQRVRENDEWFDEPDDLDRFETALSSIGGLEDPLLAAAILAYQITRAQGFTEGNKRTAFLLARWVLDINGVDGAEILPHDDRLVADLLVQAASGVDVEQEMISTLRSRA